VDQKVILKCVPQKYGVRPKEIYLDFALQNERRELHTKFYLEIFK